MKNFFFSKLLFLLMILNSAQLLAQNSASLLEEKFIDRPYILHKSQLQFLAHYNYGIRTGIFNEEGSAIALSETGESSSTHTAYLNLGYGITSFWSIRTEIQYNSGSQRQQDLIYFLYPSGYQQERFLTENNGFSDVHLSNWFMLQLLNKHLDWVIHGGIQLPTAKHDPSQPDHQLLLLDPSTQSFELNYHFLEHNGTGTFWWDAGTAFKFRTSRISFSGRLSYYVPIEEVSSYFWVSRINNQSIEYMKIPEIKKADQILFTELETGYQAFPWFYFYGSFSFITRSKGWEKYENIQVDHLAQNISFLEAGFEIQAARHIRIFQSFEYPLWGKNTDASLNFITGLSYNLFTR